VIRGALYGLEIGGSLVVVAAAGHQEDGQGEGIVFKVLIFVKIRGRVYGWLAFSLPTHPRPENATGVPYTEGGGGGGDEKGRAVRVSQKRGERRQLGRLFSCQ
jgi:hypothetical protein